MPDISTIFSSYKEEAFRLETLPTYLVEEESADFKAFLETGTVRQNPSLVEYMKDAEHMISQGIRHIRARIVPEPLTDYFIFETKVGYLPQSRIGFEFFFLDRNVIPKEFRGVQDFWLFDREHLLLMYYDEAGHFVRASFSTNPDMLSICLRVRDFFLSNGEDLNWLLGKYQIEND